MLYTTKRVSLHYVLSQKKKMSFLESASVLYLAIINSYYICFCSVRKRFKSTGLRRQSFGLVENIALENLEYGENSSTPDIPMVSPQPVQQPDAGFGNLHIDPWGRFQALDNVNNRSDNRLYVRLGHKLKIRRKAPFGKIFTNLLHFRVVLTRIFFQFLMFWELVYG